MRRDIIVEEEQIKLVRIIDEKRFQIESKTIKSLFMTEA